MILGIDIGAYWARAATLDAQGRPRLVTLADGTTALPAAARQGLHGLEVGADAAHALAGNAEITLRGGTRLLGRPRDLPAALLARLPYTVRVEEGRTLCNLLYAEVAATTVYGRVARALADAATAATGARVTGVALTVPATADERFRLQARAAVEEAGLRVLRLVNQPTAALLAASLPARAQTVAVVACGEGTTEVTLARRRGGTVTILGSAGDLWLGREEMVWHVADQLNARIRQQTGVDVYGASLGGTAAWGLHHATSDALTRLTTAAQTQIVLDHGGGFGRDLVTTVLQNEAVTWLADDYLRLINLCTRVMGRARLAPRDVDAVLLVGDGTALPKLAEHVAAQFLRPAEQLITANGANLAALGAALVAAQRGPLVWDVTPFALGINCYYDRRELFSPILAANTPIPTPGIGATGAAVERYQTRYPDQTEVQLRVLQYRGEEDPAPEGATPVPPTACEELGTWTFAGLHPKPGHHAGFAVTFAVDADGILHLLAEEEGTGHQLVAQVARPIG